MTVKVTFLTPASSPCQVVDDRGFRSPWISHQRRYILRSISTQSWASVPPAPALMATMAFRLSSGSPRRSWNSRPFDLLFDAEHVLFHLLQGRLVLLLQGHLGQESCVLGLLEIPPATGRCLPSDRTAAGSAWRSRPGSFCQKAASAMVFSIFSSSFSRFVQVKDDLEALEDGGSRIDLGHDFRCHGTGLLTRQDLPLDPPSCGRGFAPWWRGHYINHYNIKHK